MAKRDNNYSQTKDRPDYKVPVNIEDTLDFLEKQGKLPPKKSMTPNMVNDRCIQYYNNILRINNTLLDVSTSPEDIQQLRYEKSILQSKIINLVSIIIGSVIKRFKTLYPAHYNDVFTECTLGILLKINKNHYDPEKSSFHSYCYETSYQGCIKFLNDKATYENSVVSLIQD